MFYRFCWFMAFLPLRLIYRIKVIGKKNFLKKGRCVGICNHYTLLDVPAVAIRFFRQFHFIAKKELYAKKFPAWLFRHLGAIPIDRAGADLTAMRSSLKYLKEEKMLMLFPEGTRNREGGDVRGVKAGAAVFAVKGKAPIVPMVMYKPPKAFRRNYLMVGEPFELDGYYDKKMSAEDIESAGELIFEKLSGLKTELNAFVKSKKRGKGKCETETEKK